MGRECDCEQEGPTIHMHHSCSGCRYLKEEYWEYECENDEIDRGTNATCLKVQPPKHISSYWYPDSYTPGWCPFLQKNSQENAKKD